MAGKRKGVGVLEEGKVWVEVGGKVKSKKFEFLNSENFKSSQGFY